MANRKQKLKPLSFKSFESFAFRPLWLSLIPKRKTMLKNNSKTKLCNNSNSNKCVKKTIDFSLRRCSANQHADSDMKDTASNHADKTANAKLNTSSVPAAVSPRKIVDMDTSFREKTVRGNLNCFPHVCVLFSL
ncbi:hypothetical protein RND81_09G127600 [Saponaria officinalis]|uniref:Uncharacterized protein n=2 Tax=Saponaria officinalis TaxID=3572 RepID=A0AAW1ILD8_SAPOF